MIKASQITRDPILHGIDFQLERGEMVGLIGPNGAGKTTLMRALMGMDTRAKGECSLWDINTKNRAREVGWLAQDRNVSWELTVRDVIALGRTPWRGFINNMKAESGYEVNDVIARLRLESFQDRLFSELSGGERARVLIARLLAQNTPYIMADEPIASLDPKHQLSIMSLFRKLANEGRGVVISIHDLSLAARYCSRLILINEGKIIANGAPLDVLSDENLAKVFGIKVLRNGEFLQPIQTIDCD